MHRKIKMKRQNEPQISVRCQDTAGRGAVPSPMAQLFRSCQGRAYPSKSLQVRCGNTEQLAGVEEIVELKALTRFHHQPEFDLIACTFAGDREPGPELTGPLQYCRMLLKPGGRIALLLPGATDSRWYHLLFSHFPFGRSMGRGCPRVALLKQAGFVDIRRQVRPGLGRVITAQRPYGRWSGGYNPTIRT
jgi:hypothetical protein